MNAYVLEHIGHPIRCFVVHPDKQEGAAVFTSDIYKALHLPAPYMFAPIRQVLADRGYHTEVVKLPLANEAK